jgi:DNA-binding response OmpR family regulator
MKNCRSVLLVEGDPVDAGIIRRALNELKIANELVHKVSGEDALEYLRDEYSITPCVILLDLNLAGMNGFEFLETVKFDDVLKSTPVVIFTACDDDESVTRAFDLAAAGYVVKPAEYRQVVEAMRMIDRYWTASRLPNGDV